MSAPISKPLSDADKVAAFKAATSALPKWYAEEFLEPVSDTRLSELLAAVFGPAGGSSGPGRLTIWYQASGLKIWASWHSIILSHDKPIFQGRATLNAAREVYHIARPGETQMSLF